MRRSPGLRTQLLGGLVLIILVASLSIGAITVWVTRQQIAEVELQNGRLLGHALASILADAVRDKGVDRPALQRAVSGMIASSTVHAVTVVDHRLELLVSSRRGAVDPTQGTDLARAVQTEQQITRLLPGDSTLLAVSTPVHADGRLAGGVSVEILVGAKRFGWPRVFWVLMAIDGLVLVLFVALVLSRYILRPLGEMQRAAARVAEGDLAVELSEEGAYELASLASSFNTMTSSVRDQLQRLERQRQELASSRTQLIRSEKLASVGRLAAGVAHEVGNPLQAIIGFTEILRSKDLSEDRQMDLKRRIQQEAERIHHIIRELLNFARPVHEAVGAVDLQQVVQQALQLVSPQKRLKDVTVKQEGLAELPPAVANSSRLVQVMVNLLLNAADAMAGEGTITLRGQQGDGPDRMLKLRVSNTGPAIPPEHRGQVFDPFFTTKEPGEGTGLGLSVAQAIVESFGGRLILDERATLTTFVIELTPWRVDD